MPDRTEKRRNRVFKSLHTHRVAAARQLQLDHLAVWLTGSGGVPEGKKPVVTSMAGFELRAGLEPKKPVVTSMAGFAGQPCPQPPGLRNAIPANRK
jgi:hypothetical protein